MDDDSIRFDEERGTNYKKKLKTQACGQKLLLANQQPAYFVEVFNFLNEIRRVIMGFSFT